MRITLSEKALSRVFALIPRITDVASDLGVHRRTVSAWRQGTSSMPESAYSYLVSKTGVVIDPTDVERIDEREQKSNAGKLGGHRYVELYGLPGNHKSRVKGGHGSYEARKHTNGDIFDRKNIKKPPVSPLLSEFVGICMGDGSIADYAVTISLDTKTDSEYIDYVSRLIDNLFGIQPKLYAKGVRCTNIVVASVELVGYLIELGLPKGDKIRGKLDIPHWASQQNDLLIPIIRGLMDTDGCIYGEKHVRRERIYTYPRVSYRSSSDDLIGSVMHAMNNLGLHPKLANSTTIKLEHFTDIERYFTIVGSSNPKHIDRYRSFAMERSHSG